MPHVSIIIALLFTVGDRFRLSSSLSSSTGLEVLEKEMNWLEMVDELEARTPGHGVHMHRKLSSPSRQRSQIKSHQWLEEKQAKAQELRQRLLQEKSERLRDLLKKVFLLFMIVLF